MKLILKNDILELGDISYLIENTDAKIYLATTFLESQYDFFIKINKLAYKPYKDGFVIPETELRKKEIVFTLLLKNKLKKEELIFKSEPVNFRRLYVLGDIFEDIYPQAIGQLKSETEYLRNKTNILQEAVIELGKKGELL